METRISPDVLKAAKLFVAPPKWGRDHLAHPWCYRSATGANLVWASDGHTMFVANDRSGARFPRKPTPIGKPKPGAALPKWEQIVARASGRRIAKKSVWINPKYVARVMRAAQTLKVTSTVSFSLGAPHDPAMFSLGDDAFACVMPMAMGDKSDMPDWLRAMVTPPVTKTQPSKKKPR